MEVNITELGKRISWYKDYGEVYIRGKNGDFKLNTRKYVILITLNEHYQYGGIIDNINFNEDDLYITVNGREYNIEQFGFLALEA